VGSNPTLSVFIRFNEYLKSHTYPAEERFLIPAKSSTKVSLRRAEAVEKAAPALSLELAGKVL
jgi:hypothetical protein